MWLAPILSLFSVHHRTLGNPMTTNILRFTHCIPVGFFYSALFLKAIIQWRYCCAAMSHCLHWGPAETRRDGTQDNGSDDWRETAQTDGEKRIPPLSPWVTRSLDKKMHEPTSAKRNLGERESQRQDELHSRCPQNSSMRVANSVGHLDSINWTITNLDYSVK